MADDLIMTPVGYRHPSQIHHLAPGQVLSMADGRMRIIDPSTNTVTEIPTAAGSPEAAPELYGGWVCYTSWTNSTGNPITDFQTTFQVPAPPQVIADQQFFFFPGLLSGAGLLQPVLGWQGSSELGGEWSVYSAYALANGNVTYSGGVSVNPGDTLTGVIHLVGGEGGTYTYLCEFEGIPQTQLTVQAVPELTWCVETLEAYLDDQNNPCQQYPASLHTMFQGISIQTGDTYPTLDWQPVDLITTCGEYAQVVSNANPGGSVSISYGNFPPGWYWSGISNPEGVSLSNSVGVCTVQLTPTGPQLPYVFIEGKLGGLPISSLWCYWWDGIESHWSDLGAPASDYLGDPVGVVTVQTTPQAAQQPNVFIVARGGTSLWLNTSDGSTGQWTNLGAPPNNVWLITPVGVVTVQTTPQAAQQPNVFIVGNDGNLWLNKWDGTAGEWENQGTPAGVSLANPMGVITVQDNPQAPQRPYVFVRGGDGNLWCNWWNYTEWLWSVQSAPTGVSLSTGVGAITVLDPTRTAQLPYVSLEGADGNLWCAAWDGSQWNWNNQGNPGIPGVGLGSPAGMITVQDSPQAPQRPYIYFDATDGILRYNWLSE